MPLGCPVEWHHSADGNIKDASHHQTQAVKQTESSKATHKDTFQNNIAMYQDLHGTLEGKVQTSHRLIEKLETRSKSMQQNIESTKSSLAALEAAYNEKSAPIKLCAWRMEQRQKRPLREHVHDEVETALQEEQVTLADTQRKLTEAIVTTKNMIAMLTDTYDELKGDIDHKMQALSVDELCLRTTQKSWHVSAGSNASAARSGSSAVGGTPRKPNVFATDASNWNEIKRQQEARNNDVVCRRREEASVKLRADNERLVQRCGKAAKDCARKTDKCLRTRVDVVKVMRKRLENELAETRRKEAHTHELISETQSQIHAIQEPIALCSTHASWRKQRADREQIMDPVEMQLESQKQKLLRATENLRTERQNEKNILTALGEQVERLKEDLKDKTLALNIDISCLQQCSTPDGKIGSPPRSARVKSARNKTGMVDSLLPNISNAS